MKSIIFAMLIGCSKKTETASTSTEASKTSASSDEKVTVISVSNPGPKTNSGSIEIKAIVREADETTENTSKTEGSETTENSSEKSDETTTD